MSAPWYPIKLPQWDGSNAIASSYTKTAWDKGYGVQAPMQKYRDRHHDARNDLYHLANGQLNNGAVQWPLFITSVDIDFQVAGSIAQSRLTRDFYPHNFVQPAFQISGQALDEMDYGMMCDFVHMCQHGMLNNFSESSLLQLQIAHRGIPGGRNTGLTVTRNGQSFYNQSIHGPHSEIMAKGVVMSMPRVHQTGVAAPTWSFGFQVYQMGADALTNGPFAEGPPQSPGAQKTWVDLLTGAANISTDSALTKQNQKVLNWAKTHSTNVIG
jgi:hypothetical protein